SVFLFQVSLDHLDLPSFPTRRSSDLLPATGPAATARRPDVIGHTHRCSRSQSSPSSTRSPRSCCASCSASLRLHTTSSRRSHRRSEEHTSELQSRFDLVCRLLLEKKN